MGFFSVSKKEDEEKCQFCDSKEIQKGIKGVCINCSKLVLVDEGKALCELKLTKEITLKQFTDARQTLFTEAVKMKKEFLQQVKDKYVLGKVAKNTEKPFYVG